LIVNVAVESNAECNTEALMARGWTAHKVLAVQKQSMDISSCS